MHRRDAERTEKKRQSENLGALQAGASPLGGTSRPDTRLAQEYFSLLPEAVAQGLPADLSAVARRAKAEALAKAGECPERHRETTGH